MSSSFPRTTYIPGDWNAVCYTCGNRFKASQLKRHWQGFWVCEKDWEPRQPQDFVRGVPDVQNPPWTQPEPLPLGAAFCTPNGRTAIPGFSLPGCVIPAFIDPLFDPDIIVLPFV